MVLCVVVGCSGHDKDVSFYRIPAVTKRRSDQEYKLSQKRRDNFLAAISRDDLTDKILQNDRICSRHFIQGRPASLFDENNPDWLPTLNLGHGKAIEITSATSMRWERARKQSQSQVAVNTTCADENTSAFHHLMHMSSLFPSVMYHLSRLTTM